MTASHPNRPTMRKPATASQRVPTASRVPELTASPSALSPYRGSTRAGRSEGDPENPSHTTPPHLAPTSLRDDVSAAESSPDVSERASGPAASRARARTAAEGVAGS